MASIPQNPPESPGRDSRDGRTSSLVGGFIRRSKSTDILGDRRASGRLRKKLSESEQEEQLRRQKVQNTPPKLPGLPQQEQIQTFGGEDYRPRTSTMSRVAAPPVPPIPEGISNGPTDPYARTESMTNRGRYSYAQSTTSTLNSPRRVRRRKDPTPYNVLIIGARNSGKTSFLNFLKQSLALPPRKASHSMPPEPLPPSTKANKSFTHHYQEIEIENERIGLTLWDSQGLDKGIVDLQLREMSNFVESKFDESFIEEMKVVRAPGLQDTHIHCVFLILDPLKLDSNIQEVQQEANGSSKPNAGKGRRIVGALDEDFDIQVMRTLQGKTTVIPVISKADTVTTAHMAYLKKMVLQGLKRSGLDPLEGLNFETEDSDDDKFDEADEDENDEDSSQDDNIASENASTAETGKSSENKNTGKEHILTSSRKSAAHKREPSTMSVSDALLESGYLPFSILSPDAHSLDPGQGPVGRKFPWGFADPYNKEHCDFVKLKEACFREWRTDLREASRDVFYERWRTSRLNRNNPNGVRGPAGRKSSTAIPFSLTPRIKR